MSTTQRVNEVTSDELSFSNNAVSLCMLINRRHKSVRVIDFRAGASLPKRNFILQAAKREGLQKVYLLVERDEVIAWGKFGFRREANIPGFYKRSDAWVMGAVVGETIDLRPEENDYDEDDGPEEPTSTLLLAKKTLEKAKKLAKVGPEKSGLKLTPLKKDAANKIAQAATQTGRALTGFEQFSRDAERAYLTLSGKGFELLASLETQPSFACTMLELLESPADDAARGVTTEAIKTLVTKIAKERASSVFSLTPSDDVNLASCFLAAGFTMTGALESHLRIGARRRDAIVWSRALVDN